MATEDESTFGEAEPEFSLRPDGAIHVPTVRLTETGLRRLQEELDELEEHALPAVAERIKTIREMSADPAESGELAQAMDEMAQLQARAATLRARIGEGEVVAPEPAAAGKVHLGSKVTLAENSHRETFILVGAAESDATVGLLSEDSPLGRSLLGHRRGDEVRWESPAGENQARIVRLE